jgi:hypothetical protein
MYILTCNTVTSEKLPNASGAIHLNALSQGQIEETSEMIYIRPHFNCLWYERYNVLPVNQRCSGRFCADI